MLGCALQRTVFLILLALREEEGEREGEGVRVVDGEDRDREIYIDRDIWKERK